VKPTVRFFRHDGVYRPMGRLFESPTRSAAFRSGPGQTFRTHRKLLRPAHRRDEPRPVIPQRVARQHCPPPLHRHAHPKSVPGSGTMNFQRTVNSVLTVCLSPGDNLIRCLSNHSHSCIGRERSRRWPSFQVARNRGGLEERLRYSNCDSLTTLFKAHTLVSTLQRDVGQHRR
jgi:hypothetical protein